MFFKYYRFIFRMWELDSTFQQKPEAKETNVPDHVYYVSALYLPRNTTTLKQSLVSTEGVTINES